ncbi:MAG: hypothetical protein KAI84_20870, partial [Gammaproteobacteria bacterium]|nr:hypothetical protein [Gammaproteobacteria bacterium]
NLLKMNSINSSLEKEAGRIDFINHSFSISFRQLVIASDSAAISRKKAFTMRLPQSRCSFVITVSVVILEPYYHAR